MQTAKAMLRSAWKVSAAKLGAARVSAIRPAVARLSAVRLAAARPPIGRLARRPVVVVTVTAVAAAGVTVAINLASRAPAAPTPAATAVPTEVPQFALHRGDDVWAGKLDNSPVTDLTNLPGNDERSPAYSWDGQRLAYSSGSAGGHAGIVVASFDGSNPKTLTDPIPIEGPALADDEPTWSKDGSMIAFTRTIDPNPGLFANDSQILVAKVDSSLGNGNAPIVGQIPCGGGVCHDSAPAWSPDGTKIAFSRAFGPRYLDDSMHIFTVNVERDPADPTHLVFTHLFDVSTGGASSSGAVFHDHDADWSPRGDSIAFARVNPRGGADALYTTAPTGTGQTLVISGRDNLFNLRGPAFTPDGKSLVFSASTDIEGDSDLWQVPLPGPGVPPPATVPVTVVLGGTSNEDQPAFRPIADLTATLEADPAAIPLDGTSAVKLTVFNDGTHIAPNSIVTITVPAGLSVTSAPPPALCPPPGTMCNLGDLAPGDQVVVPFTVRGTALGAQVVTATATSGRADPDGSNDKPSVTIQVGTKPDVDVHVEVNRTPAPVNGPPIVVTYTIHNGGDFPATDVRLTTGLPAQLKVLSVDPAAGCTVQPPACALGTVAAGATVTVTFKLSADAVVDTSVTGHVSSPVDANPANNDASTPLRVIAADLAVTVDVAPEPGAVGGDPVTVTYTVVNGNFEATDVVLTAGLPKPLPIKSVNPAGACPSTSTAVCALGTLAPHTTRTITFTLSPDVPIDTVVTADVTGLLFREARVGGKDSHRLRLIPPDLALTIAAAPQPGFLGGDPIAVTYTVSNHGQFEARGVHLAVSLPNQLPFDSLSTSAGTCTPPPVTGCTLNTVPKGGTVTVTYRVKPAVAGDTTVSGEVTENVADATPGDNKATIPLSVHAPTLTLDPPIGPPGFVSQAIGHDFPPGATVRLTWQPGITAQPDTIVVDAAGNFTAPALVLPKDQLGPRNLTATPVQGPAFGPVAAPFLVTAGEIQPGDFVSRR